MTTILGIATIVLAVHVASSYILLTANLDDVQAIAKQLSHSPVADQLKNIWRRATGQFNHYVNRAQYRGHDAARNMQKKFKINNDDEATQIEESREDPSARRHQTVNNEIQDLQKNASFYLSSIKKIMDGI